MSNGLVIKTRETAKSILFHHTGSLFFTALKNTVLEALVYLVKYFCALMQLVTGIKRVNLSQYEETVYSRISRKSWRNVSLVIDA